MIAEEYQSEYLPQVSIPKGITIGKILNCFKNTAPLFRSALSDPKLRKPLNEDKFTQIFVEQIDIQLRKDELGIGVKNQYSDLFWGTRGKPDFYFHVLEEGKVAEPIFIVEAKRLPSYSVASEMEYVVGDSENGGLERFKIEKHGQGQEEFGMLGFVEENDFPFWLAKINGWLQTLSSQPETIWYSNEIIQSSEAKPVYNYLKSILYTKTRRTLAAHHFWVACSSTV